MGIKYKIEVDGSKFEWDKIKSVVLEKIEALRLVWSHDGGNPELHKKLVEELYFPALKQLMIFCDCIKIEDGDTDI